MAITNFNFLSVIIPIASNGTGNKIKKFITSLQKSNFKYEIILCTRASSNNFNQLNSIVNEFPNTSAYEVLSKDLDNVVSHGLSIALGDWIIILEDDENFLVHFDKILEKITSTGNLDLSSVILTSNKMILRDKILVFMSRYLMEEKVPTFQRVSKAASRNSLIKWNQRAFKNKVLRVASSINVNARGAQEAEIKIASSYNSHRLFRIGLRTIIYSSVSPLRFVSIVSIFASGLAAAYSAYVVFIKYSDVPTPGWASTNLLISISSLLILVILSALCEYMYQLIGAVVQSHSIRVSSESMNSRYSFVDDKDVHDNSI